MRFLQHERAAAGIFFALGAGSLLTASTLTFDLVRFVSLLTRADRAVVTIADFASRDPEVDCHEISALGQFVHRETFGDQSAAVLTLTSATGDADEEHGFAQDWTMEPLLEFGPEGVSSRLENCLRDLATNRSQTLQALAMTDGEGVVMAQLCLAPDAGQFLVPAWVTKTVGLEIYRYHVLPARNDTLSLVCA